VHFDQWLFRDAAGCRCGRGSGIIYRGRTEVKRHVFDHSPKGMSTIITDMALEVIHLSAGTSGFHPLSTSRPPPRNRGPTIQRPGSTINSNKPTQPPWPSLRPGVSWQHLGGRRSGQGWQQPLSFGHFCDRSGWLFGPCGLCCHTLHPGIICPSSRGSYDNGGD
jgi:hypothetical protein